MSNLFRFKLSAFFRRHWLVISVIVVISFMMLCIVSSVKKDRATEHYPGLTDTIQESPVKKAPEVKEEYKGATSSIIMAMEYAYMEGQRDYIQGEIKIVEVNGDYKWTKSPWDGGRAAVHNYLSEYVKAFEEFEQ